jgi:alpha-L-rhamnosidase
MVPTTSPQTHHKASSAPIKKKRSLHQNFSALGIGCLLLGALNGRVLADSDVGPGPDSSEPLLRPVKVVSTTGNVSNAEALIEGHGGSATLTMVQGGAAPMIILDYGRDVGGLPVFEVTSVTGTPNLQAFYSEAQQYLLPDGDAAAPGTVQDPSVAQPEVSFVGDAAGADLSRSDTYPLSRPGLIVNRLIQGGERFEAITLASPGNVTLRKVGIQAKFFIPRQTKNRGSFNSSDPAINEIWHLGSSALELCSVPTRSLPPKWAVTPEGVEVPGNEYSGYQGGATWTDYTANFNVQVLTNEAAWLVRASDFNGVRLVLAADNDALGISKPNTLRAYVQFSKAPLGEATVPEIKPGSWHSVRNEVVGNTAQIFLDNQLILTLDLPTGGGPFGSLATGFVAFGNEQGAVGLFRNLLVTDLSNNVLYESSLTDPSILDQFATGTNVLPSIMDGAKRDRLDFTGDIEISGLTLLYSNFALKYLAGSIDLFSSYQLPNGRIATSVPPQFHPGVTPPTAINATSLLIADYDLQQVTSIFHYYLYTGDKAFLQAQWPVVQKVIAFFNTLTNNPQHLIVPPSAFGPPSADTLTNAHFYGVLLQGALLAEAMDHADIAAGYRATAAQLRVAINTNLFNNTTGLYDVSTAQRGVAPQDGNSYAILYGVAPPQGKSVTSILQTLTTALYRTPSAPNETGPIPVQQSSGSTQVGPYTSAYELFARFESGDTTGALALIRNEWGLMRKSSAFYSGATWEYVALDGTPGLGEGTSLAHGWGSGPTSALSKYVLGVRPIQAGYKTWLVEPQPGDLSWATGTVPTPYGPIAVGWRQNNNSFEVTVSVPSGTSGTVGIPSASGTVSVTDNGRVIKSISASNVSNGQTGYVYLQNLQPGEHVILTTK